MAGKLLQYLGMWLMVAVCAAPGQAAPLQAEEVVDRGQALYENHCRVCHDAYVHTRDARRVHDLGELQLYVSTWSFHAQLDWSREEIADVVDYLDRSYYHFTEQP
jgi:mono/diheme cytochrome c family protein